jgi:FkbM family methyltransferase
LKFILKNFLEKITGARIYRNSLPRGISMVEDIKKLSEKPIGCIWDVGAHKGETTLFFAEYFPKSEIKSFEPISSNFIELEKNCSRLKKQQSFQLALGDTVKDMEIYLQSGSVIHSLREDLNKPVGTSSKKEVIEQVTIDSILKNETYPQIDLLKIDVEGYELAVLEGASNSLSNKVFDFIYLETGIDNRFNPIDSFMEILNPQGYLQYAFYEQSPHWTGRQSLWYWNTLFVKEELL